MNKKAYIAPAITDIEADSDVQLLVNSITEVSGDAGIVKGDPADGIPTAADSRGFSVWNDELDY